MTLYHRVFAFRPANADPLFPLADVKAYRISDRPCGPGLAMPWRAEERRHRGDARQHEHRQRKDEHGQHRHLDFVGLDLLAEIFRRAPDHQPGDEDGENDEQSMPYMPGADPAEDHLAEHDVDQRHETAERRERIVRLFTAPQLASVVTVAKSAESAMPNRTSLPSILPPGASALAA